LARRIAAAIGAERKTNLMNKAPLRKPNIANLLPIFQPLENIVGTKSLYFYFYDFSQIVESFIFTVKIAASVDQYATNAAHALAAIDKGLLEEETEEKIAELERRRNAQLARIEAKGAQKQLAEYSMMNVRHLVTTLADCFLTFVSHLIQSALKKSRNTLKSSETIRIDDLLEFKTNKALTNYLIDRKINELSYGGIRKIEEYIKDILGIDMFKDDKSRDLLIIFLELRNIYVHNRGFVNNLFLTRAKKHSRLCVYKRRTISA
jgi:hypothetical protein